MAQLLEAIGDMIAGVESSSMRERTPAIGMGGKYHEMDSMGGGEGGSGVMSGMVAVSNDAVPFRCRAAAVVSHEEQCRSVD